MRGKTNKQLIENMKIIVANESTPSGKLTGEWRAFPEGKPDIQGHGVDMRAAVSDLIFTHGAELNITIDTESTIQLK